MAAPSPNAQIADQLIARDLQARRVEAGLRREVWAQLTILEQDILSALKSADPTQWALLARRRREVATLMAEEIDPLVTARYARLADFLDAAMLRLARHEAGAVQTVINDVTEAPTVEEPPSERQLRAGVVQGLFPSAAQPTDFSTFSADWWQRQAASLSQRIGDSLTTGVALEETLTALASRVRGTSDNAFQDGLMAKARTDAARLLTTQMTNTVSAARVAVADRTPDAFVLVHLSIHDLKTSLICIARDGKRFTAGTHEPIGHTLPYLSGVPYHPS